MRGIIVMILGVFIFVYTVHDSLDGEFDVASKSSSKVIYEADNPEGYRNAVIMQSLIGIVAIGLGYWVWRNGKK